MSVILSYLQNFHMGRYFEREPCVSKCGARSREKKLLPSQKYLSQFNCSSCLNSSSRTRRRIRFSLSGTSSIPSSSHLCCRILIDVSARFSRCSSGYLDKIISHRRRNSVVSRKECLTYLGLEPILCFTSVWPPHMCSRGNKASRTSDLYRASPDGRTSPTFISADAA